MNEHLLKGFSRRNVVRYLDTEYDHVLSLLSEIIRLHQKKGGKFTISLDGWSFQDFKCVGLSCYFNLRDRWKHVALELPYQSNLEKKLKKHIVKKDKTTFLLQEEEEELIYGGKEEEDDDDDEDEEEEERELIYGGEEEEEGEEEEARRIRESGEEPRTDRFFFPDKGMVEKEESSWTPDEFIFLSMQNRGDNRFAVYKHLHNCLTQVGIKYDNVTYMVTDGGANYRAGVRIFSKAYPQSLFHQEFREELNADERDRWVYCGLHWLQLSIFSWVKDQRCTMLNHCRMLCKTLHIERKAFAKHKLQEGEKHAAGLNTNDPKVYKTRSDANPDTRWYGAHNMVRSILKNKARILSYFNLTGMTRTRSDVDLDIRYIPFDALESLYEDLDMLHERYQLLQDEKWGLCSCILPTIWKIKKRFDIEPNDEPFPRDYNKGVFWGRIKKKNVESNR